MCRLGACRNLLVGVLVLCSGLSSLDASPLMVTGSVTTEALQPMPDARIRLFRQQDNISNLRRWLGVEQPHVVMETQTDAAGRYQIAVETPALWRLVVDAPGHVPMLYALLPLTADRELAPVALIPLEDVRLQLRDAAKQPLNDVLVSAQSSDPSWWRSRSAAGWSVNHRYGRTNDRGELTLPRAVGESLDLVALPPGGATLHQRTAAAEAVSSDHRPSRDHRPSGDSRLGWTIAAANGELVVEIQESDGKAAPGVLVIAGYLPLGQTDTKGRLTLSVTESEELQLHLLTPDGRHQRRPLTVQSTEQAQIETLRLPVQRVLQGRVIDAAKKGPLSDALVWTGGDPGRFTFSDDKGAFTLPVASAGRFWVQAEAAGSLPLLQYPQGTADGWVPPVLALTPVAGLSGQVVDGQGQPLAGVLVSASPEERRSVPPAFRPDPVHGRVVSDAKGRFTLAGLHPQAAFNIAAASPGYGRAMVRVHDLSQQPTSVRLELRPARPAFGRVLDDKEQPVVEAEVKVVESAGGQSSLPPVKTDAEGRFEVADVPSPRLDIEVAKEGYPPVNVRAIPVAEGTEPLDLGIILLRRGLTISGQVVDVEGEPIIDAKIVAMPAAEDSQKSLANRKLSSRPTQSDAKGTFILQGLLAEQRVFLTIEHPGYLGQVVEGVEVPIDVPLKVVMQRAARVSGRVEDPSGEPIVGAEVRLGGVGRAAGTVGLRTAGDDNALQTVSDDQGQFDLPGVIPGTVELEAVMEDFLPSEAQRLEIERGAWTDDVVLVLRRGNVLTGRVTNGRGQPVAGARLTLGHTLARSDAEGAYRLSGLPLGDLELEARHPEYNRTTRQVTIEPEDNSLDLVFEGGATVLGRVLDGAQKPVVGASVRFEQQARRDFHQYHAISDSEGAFEVPSVALGHYRVVAERQGFASHELEGGLDVDEQTVEDVELFLSPGTELSGQVRGLDFAELSEVEVEAQSGPYRSVPAVVDYEGKFRIEDLGPGVWKLKARLYGGRREAESRVAISSGVERIEKDIEFGGGLTLSGQVLFDGEPLPRTWVSVRGLGIDLERSVTSDYEGRFRLLDLKPGSYRLSLSSNRETMVHNEDLELVEDRDVLVDLAPALVSGVVTAESSHRPIEEALVYLQQMHGEAQNEPGSLITVATDANGGFSLARVSGGNYQLRVEKKGFGPWQQPLRVETGVDVGPLDVALDATEGLGLLVRLANGETPRWVSLSLFDDSERHVLSSRQLPDSDGMVSFPSVPKGTWKFRLGAPGAVAVDRTVTVPAEPMDVVLDLAGGLRVEVPALAESDRLATLTVVDVAGQPFEQADVSGSWVRQWPVQQGSVRLDGLPTGSWRLEVVASDGQRWQGEANTFGGQEVGVRLP